MIRERNPDCLAGKKVVGRLIINRHEQISFRHEIIRVRGRQPVPLRIENRIRQRQFHQVVGFPFHVSEKRQLGAHPQ